MGSYTKKRKKNQVNLKNKKIGGFTEGFIGGFYGGYIGGSTEGYSGGYIGEFTETASKIEIATPGNKPIVVVCATYK